MTSTQYLPSSKLSDDNQNAISCSSEIIEERRKDADGRVLVYRYLKGKLLGKVSWPREHQILLTQRHIFLGRFRKMLCCNLML